jgi:hypothetical protein
MGAEQERAVSSIAALRARLLGLVLPGLLHALQELGEKTAVLPHHEAYGGMCESAADVESALSRPYRPAEPPPHCTHLSWARFLAVPEGRRKVARRQAQRSPWTPAPYTRALKGRQ